MINQDSIVKIELGLPYSPVPLDVDDTFCAIVIKILYLSEALADLVDGVVRETAAVHLRLVGHDERMEGSCE
jgi:hypothetical protein